jgi:fructose/tagatose bisphosphate aldolase
LFFLYRKHHIMALVSMRELLDHAAQHNYGIPAFNVNNLEQVQAVMTAADEVGAPVILQASAGARKYAGEAFIKHLILAAVEQWPHIPLVMHQDHGSSPKVCQGAIDLGFGSVMMDGSLMEDAKTPASFDYNVEVTRKVVDMAHKMGVTVEGELGCLGNLETGEAGEEDGVGAEGKLDHSQMLTDPEEAAVFVKATQLDALDCLLLYGLARIGSHSGTKPNSHAVQAALHVLSARLHQLPPQSASTLLWALARLRCRPDRRRCRRGTRAPRRGPAAERVAPQVPRVIPRGWSCRVARRPLGGVRRPSTARRGPLSMSTERRDRAPIRGRIAARLCRSSNRLRSHP